MRFQPEATASEAQTTTTETDVGLEDSVAMCFVLTAGRMDRVYAGVGRGFAMFCASFPRALPIFDREVKGVSHTGTFH
jgi:hypothetical protein